MLDDSYSMRSDNRWTNLKKCVDKFIDDLTGNKDCHISIIIYNNTSRIVISNAVPTAALKQKVVYKGGMTDYNKPLKDCINICK